MPTSYTNLLGLALPVTGELSGTWGDTVNDYITQYLDASVAGTQTISGSQTAVTLSKTTNASLSQAGSGATGSSQYLIINCTGNPASLLTITAPAASKTYVVVNATSTNQDVKIVGAGPTTGVTLVAGEKAVIAWNGSDFIKVASSVADGVTSISFGSTGLTPSTTTTGAVTVAGTLAVANGGTNATATPTAGAVAYGTGTAYAFTSAGTSGQVLQSNGSSAPSWANAATGTVTSVAAGTGMSFSTITSTGSVAIDTTVVPRYANAGTFTATQTFSGSSSALSMVLNDAAEVITVSATAATGTINYDITTQSVVYYTTNASANWTVNFRASSGTSLNTALATGQCVTVAFLVTQGSTAYYNSAVQVDGNSVTPKWQGGTAPTSGNINSIDAYVYTIVKTGAATFTVFASQTKFA